MGYDERDWEGDSGAEYGDDAENEYEYDDEADDDEPAGMSLTEFLRSRDYAMKPEALMRIIAVRELLENCNGITNPVEEELVVITRAYTFTVREAFMGLTGEELSALGEMADALTIMPDDDNPSRPMMVISIWHAADVVEWSDTDGWVAV